MYTDHTGQHWDSREEMLINNSEVERKRTEAAIDAAGLREEMDAAYAAHSAVVEAQQAELATAPSSGPGWRESRRKVCQRYLERLDASSRAISAIRDKARDAIRMKTYEPDA